MSLYCMENHRTAEQLEQMRRLDAAGVCLFCPQGLREHAGQEVLWESEHWAVTPNKYPYRSTSLHLLLIPHQHVGDLIDLDPAAQADFWAVLAQIRSRWDLTYYGLGARNGDCRFTGGTIEHVHAHVLVGDADTAAQVPVRMRFSSNVAVVPDPHRPDVSIQMTSMPAARSTSSPRSTE